MSVGGGDRLTCPTPPTRASRCRTRSSTRIDVPEREPADRVGRRADRRHPRRPGARRRRGVAHRAPRRTRGSRWRSARSVQSLPADTTARVRPASVLGLTYVELELGRSERAIPEGGALRLAQARPSSDLTDLLDVFERSSRAPLPARARRPLLRVRRPRHGGQRDDPPRQPAAAAADLGHVRARGAAHAAGRVPARLRGDGRGAGARQRRSSPARSPPARRRSRRSRASAPR